MLVDFSELHAALRSMGDPLVLWAVFERPSDHPEHFVVRPQIVSQRGVQIWHQAWPCDSLSEARHIIPRGLSRMPRHTDDAPHLIETWM